MVLQYSIKTVLILKEIMANKTIPNPDELLKKIQQHPQFIKDKWYTCLKYLLMEENICDAQAKPFISSGKRIKELVTYLNTYRVAYEKELFREPEFIQYLLNNPDAIKNICEEFQVYNKKYAEKNPSLKINIPAIQKKYANAI